MAEVTGVGGRPLPPEGSSQSGGTAAADGARILLDVPAGPEAARRAAAERMRASGGATAVEALLRLDREPPMLGAFPAPRGNREALRRLSPMERRRIMRAMLKRQRTRLAGLLNVLNEEGGGEEPERHLAPFGEAEDSPPGPGTGRREQARRELEVVERMIQLLAEMLDRQDYTLSQIGTFQS